MTTQISGAADIEVNPRAEELEQVAQLWRGLNGQNLPCLVILDNFPETWRFGPTCRQQEGYIP